MMSSALRSSERVTLAQSSIRTPFGYFPRTAGPTFTMGRSTIKPKSGSMILSSSYTLSIASKASSSSLFTLTVPSANRYSREERASASLMETSPITQSLVPYFLTVFGFSSRSSSISFVPSGTFTISASSSNRETSLLIRLSAITTFFAVNFRPIENSFSVSIPASRKKRFPEQ